MAMHEVRQMLATTRGLISDYHSVDFFRLRESLGERPHVNSDQYAIFRLTYYVEYVTFDGQRCYPGNKHAWNVLADGFPGTGSLRLWSRRHGLTAQSRMVYPRGEGPPQKVELIVVHAVLRRSDDGTIEAKWQLPHIATRNQAPTQTQLSISLQGSKRA